MLSFMNIREIEQPNLGRIHIDKESLMTEVARNGGRITFDAHGYEQFKTREGLDEPYSDVPQFVRPRGGALHDRAERDPHHSSSSGPPHNSGDGGSQEQRSDYYSHNEGGKYK
jgi:hypothetical protein